MTSKRTAAAEAAPETVHLRYTGEGEYIPGVPTTDLEVSPATAEHLIATGLYVAGTTAESTKEDVQ